MNSSNNTAQSRLPSTCDGPSERRDNAGSIPRLSSVLFCQLLWGCRLPRAGARRPLQPGHWTDCELRTLAGSPTDGVSGRRRPVERSCLAADLTPVPSPEPELVRNARTRAHGSGLATRDNRNTHHPRSAQPHCRVASDSATPPWPERRPPCFRRTRGDPGRRS